MPDEDVLTVMVVGTISSTSKLLALADYLRATAKISSDTVVYAVEENWKYTQVNVLATTHTDVTVSTSTWRYLFTSVTWAEVGHLTWREFSDYLGDMQQWEKAYISPDYVEWTEVSV